MYTLFFLLAVGCRVRKKQISEPIKAEKIQETSAVRSFGDIDLTLDASDETVKDLIVEQIEDKIIHEVQGVDKIAPTAMMVMTHKNKPTGASLWVDSSYDISPTRNTFDPSSAKCKRNSGVMSEFYRVSPLPKNKNKLGHWQQMDRPNCERMGLPDHKFVKRGHYLVEMKVVDSAGLESHASATYSVSSKRKNSVSGFRLSASKLLLEPHEVSEIKPLDCPKYGKVLWTKTIEDKTTDVEKNNIGVNIYGESEGNVLVKATCVAPGNVKFYASLTLAIEQLK